MQVEQNGEAFGAVRMVRLSKPRRWAALGVLLLGMLVLSFDMTIMDIALPSMAKELQPTADQQLWMVDVYSLALAGLLVCCSSLSDRIGRKRTFALGSLMFCLASALVLFAGTSNAVIGVRALMGVSAAMIMPNTMSMIRNVFEDPRERALSLCGMALLMWAVKRMAATLSVSDPTVLGGLVLGVVLMVLFVVRCLRADEPLLDVRLFCNRAFTGGIATAFGAMFASAAIFFLLSQWLQLVGGYSPMEAGLRMLPVAVASAVSGAAAPVLALRIGARPVMVGGVALAALSMLAIVAGGVGITYAYVAASMVLSGLSMGAFSVGSTVIMCSTPPESASSGAAFEEIAYDVGNVLGVALLGSVAGIVYRSGLSVGQLSALGLSAEQIDAALGSYGAAVAIAQEAGVSELMVQGARSFNESFVLTAAVGAVLLLLLMFAVSRLIPKRFSIAEEERL